MNFTDFPVGSDDCDRRLDRLVRKFLPKLQISLVYKNIRTGFIRVNNKKQKQDYIMQDSDVLNIARILLENRQNNPEKKNTQNEAILKAVLPNVLFKNENYLVMNKPYDISVQGNSQNGISLNKIICSLYTNPNSSLAFTPGPLHRLDRKTTGALVFSQSLKGAQWFSQAIKDKIIIKEYVGIVCGTITENYKWRDLIDDSYKNGGGFRTVKIINSDNKNSSSTAKKAITNVEPLEHALVVALGKTIPLTLCRFIIETGRMHQIRAQSAFHGFPLTGDSAYSTKEYKDIKLKSFGIHDTNQKDQIPEFLLHAIRLQIPENSLGLPTKIIAPIPLFFKNIITNYFASYSFKLII